MSLVGYARVSSLGQSLEVQEELLRAAGCEKLFQEKKSGKTTNGRQALADALEWVREGDVLLVTRLDRIARSVDDLRTIIKALEAKGVGFRAIQQGEIDTTSPHGRLMLNLLGAVAEFETDLRRDRQAEGIAKAKASGVYKGGKPQIDRAKVLELHAAKVSPSKIAKDLKISRQSVYRIVG